MGSARELNRREPVKAVIAEDEANLLGELRETLAVLWPELSICAVATRVVGSLVTTWFSTADVEPRSDPAPA